jgi:Pro-kumamolisin, activation domain
VVLLRPHPDAHKPYDMEEWERIPNRHQRARRGTSQAAAQGATQEDADKVAAYATDQGLKVVDINLPRRIVQLSGTVAQADRAFGVTLGL